MLKLDEDVFFLILKELQYDSNSLYSCLLARKAWSEIIIPILWKNPWKFLNKRQKKSLFNVIISHLSNEAKENLRIQGVRLSTSQQKPLFNYISFCRHLKLCQLEDLIDSNHNIKKSKISIIIDEILKLFINGNTKITHLYIPRQFDRQIHLISGAEYCFSELEFLCCFAYNTKQDILEGISRISKSIRGLKLHTSNYNSGIVKLIESQENLNDVCIGSAAIYSEFNKTLEELLINKHADTIQYLQINWTPGTKILSRIVNLISLEFNMSNLSFLSFLNNLENVSLPDLKILKTRLIMSEVLESLMKSTKGHLTEISMNYYDKRHIQPIYQNCPNLKYLKLTLCNVDFSGIEELLINCQYLDGLVIRADMVIDWNGLFRILTKSSPESLFKLKFYFTSGTKPKLESLNIFFKDWKGRRPMLLQISQKSTTKWVDLIKRYKAEGVIKNFDNNWYEFEDFEWIQKKNLLEN